MLAKAEQQVPDTKYTQAICAFHDGERRHLYATELNQGRAFILALRPPVVGTVLTITFQPCGQSPLPEIEARVVAVRIDPDDLERTGFEVAFTRVDEATLAKLPTATSGLACRRVGELRVAPRVVADLQALVQIDDGPQMPVRVLNLSMSGVLVSTKTRKVLARDAFVPGANAQLTIIHAQGPEHLTIRAEIVRHTGPDEPEGFGLRFVDVDEANAGRLEGLIIASLVSTLRPCASDARSVNLFPLAVLRSASRA